MDGAEAFVRYVWALYDYSYTAQETGAFRKISDPGCKFCKNTIDSVTANWRDHSKSVGGEVTVKAVLVPPADPGSGIIVTMIIDQTPSWVVEADGRITNREAGGKDTRIDMAIAWNPGAWIVLESEYIAPTKSTKSRTARRSTGSTRGSTP